MSPYQGVLSRYRGYLNIPAHILITSLMEGNTPLIPMPRLANELGGGFDLFVKFEGLNPTGSFKDRGMSIAIGEAAGRETKKVICASTGNTAASAAAYSAHMGLECIVLIPQGKVAAGKLAGAVAHGAQVIQIQGSFDEALTLVVELSNQTPITLVNSLNPYRLEGQKTAAFEICDTLNQAPDWLCLPVGNAGNITAYWMGFQQYHIQRKMSLPHLMGVQAIGAAPLVIGHPIINPETVATAIRIGNPARGEQALQAADESAGCIIAVTDNQILEAQKKLASHGIWVEPASAAGLAGLEQEIKQNHIHVKGLKIVIVCTGHGLKDPEIITRDAPVPKVIPADMNHLYQEIIKE